MEQENKKEKKKMSKKKIILIVCALLAVILLLDELFQEEYYPVDGGAAVSGQPGTPPETAYERVFAVFPPGHIVHDTRVHAMEINQSLSWGFDSLTGEFFLMDHFAAGKETAIFIQFSEPVNNILAGGTSVFLEVYRDGVYIVSLEWIDHADDHTLWFQPRAMADVEHWAAGDYRFVVLVDGENVAERTTRFHQSGTLRVLAVPIVTNYGGNVVYPHGIWKTGGAMLHGTFPVARADVEFVLGATLDLRHYDIMSRRGPKNVWRALVNLQTPNNDFDAIMGFVPDPIPSECGNFSFLGFTYGAPAAVSSESDPEMLATVIHEIAHFYNIGDEYEGGHINLRTNPPPYGMSGPDWNDWLFRPTTGYRRAITGGRDIGWAGTGSVIHAQQRPFYVEGRKHLNQVTSYMGGGGPGDPWAFWVTSDIWIHKFRTFTGAVGGMGGTGAPVEGIRLNRAAETYQCPNCFIGMSEDLQISENDGREYIFCEACNTDIPLSRFLERNAFSARAARVAEPSYVWAIEIRGIVGSDGSFDPAPWYTFETCSSELDNLRDGRFAVHFYDENGSQLSASFFNIDFYATFMMPDGNQRLERDEMPVDLLVSFPEATASIAIYREGAEIYSVTLTQTAPTVEFTGMTDYQNIGNSFTLTWEAEGQRELFFDIWYSPSDDIWYNIATDITGRSFTADFYELPGTSEGYFIIYATDGVRTAYSFSPWVEVPYKAPTIITDLSEIPRFAVTDEFILDVDIADLQDISLWCVDEVTWTLDGRHFMGGSGLWIWPFELNPGYHTFHLEAVNSAGLSVEGEFTVYVIDDDSALPDDWSRDDIVSGLSQGFIVDLRRLDAPITRGRFATFMLDVYFDMLEGDFDYMDFPEYEEGVILDGGQDSYDFFVMTYLGMMEASEGRFNPNGTVTEREAALIMYRTAALADPQWFWDDADDDQILGWLSEIGALEDDGPNAFNESEPLTSRLAMVRLARFYAAVFE